jgi:hypothetical protein
MNILRIAIAALRHGMNVGADIIEPGHKTLVEQRIQSVLDGTFDVAAIKRMRARRQHVKDFITNASLCFVEASENLILLAGQSGHLSGWKLSCVFWPTRQALDFADPLGHRTQKENIWQVSNLYPLIEKAFEYWGTWIPDELFPPE